MFTREARVHQALNETVCRLAHERRIWPGQSLQTRSEIDRVAQNRNACVGTVVHFPDHRRSGVETDAQLRAHAVFRFKIRS